MKDKELYKILQEIKYKINELSCSDTNKKINEKMNQIESSDKLYTMIMKEKTKFALKSLLLGLLTFGIYIRNNADMITLENELLEGACKVTEDNCEKYCNELGYYAKKKVEEENSLKYYKKNFNEISNYLEYKEKC